MVTEAPHTDEIILINALFTRPLFHTLYGKDVKSFDSGA